MYVRTLGVCGTHKCHAQYTQVSGVLKKAPQSLQVVMFFGRNRHKETPAKLKAFARSKFLKKVDEVGN